MCRLIAALLSTLLCFPAIASNHLERYEAGHCTLLVEWRGDFTPEQKNKLLEWQSAVIKTVAMLHGQPPRNPIRVVFQPYPANTAVPFARVLRRNPQGVLYYVNPDQPLAEFITDWTAYHEMSHLFIPYPGMADIWFSEGLASYYQNILQFRAGLLTADEAKNKLRKGFQRGRNDNNHSELTLRQLSEAMHKKRAYMRVYWSGALYFLAADLALRAAVTETTAIQSLDDLLRVYGECCLGTERQSGAELAQQFDRIANTELFVPLYQRYSESRFIPEYGPLLDSDGMDAILPGRTGADNLTVQ